MSLLLSLLASSGGGGVASAPAPTPVLTPRLKLGQDVHIHIDANSLFARWIAPGLETVGNFGKLVSSSGATTSNSAIPGQTWDDMRLAASDVDSAYVSGKTNVLVTGETTNQVYNAGSSVEQTIQKAQQYITARKLAHPDWIILLVGTIPRADLATPELNRAANQKLIEVDAYHKANMLDVGIHGFVDIRRFAPEWFALRSDGATAAFMDSLDVCNSYDGKVPDMVHPVNVARTAFADAVALGITQLPSMA